MRGPCGNFDIGKPMGHSIPNPIQGCVLPARPRALTWQPGGIYHQLPKRSFRHAGRLAPLRRPLALAARPYSTDSLTQQFCWAGQVHSPMESRRCPHRLGDICDREAPLACRRASALREALSYSRPPSQSADRSVSRIGGAGGASNLGCPCAPSVDSMVAGRENEVNHGARRARVLRNRPRRLRKADPYAGAGAPGTGSLAMRFTSL